MMLVMINSCGIDSDICSGVVGLRVTDKSVFKEYNQVDIYITEEPDNSVQTLIDQYIDAVGKIFQSEYPEGRLSSLNLHFNQLPFDRTIRDQSGWKYADPFIRFCEWLEAGMFGTVYVNKIPERYSDIADFGINFVFKDVDNT